MPTVTAKDLTAPQTVGTIEPVKPIAAAPTQEVKPTEPTHEDRMKQMAYREQVIRNQSRRFQEEKKAFDEQRKAFEAQQIEVDKYKNWDQQIESDPLGFLTGKGITPDKLTSILLNQPDLTQQQVKMLTQKIQMMEEKQNQVQKQMEENQTQSYNQALKQISNEVKMLVDGDELFETIKNTNSEHAVVKLIEDTFAQDGVLMDVETAAKEVEEYLVEEALKLTKLKKIQGKLNMPLNEVPIQKPKPGITTLTHNIQQNTKPLTDKERKQRAILAFQGKLNG